MRHSDSHVGLDADDDRFSAPESCSDGKRLERPRDERVDDVERGNVDDYPSRAAVADSIGEIVAEGEKLAVAQVSLDRGDQVVALAKDRDCHGDRLALSAVAACLALVEPVTKQALGFLQSTLEIPDGLHHRKVDSEVDERLRDLR